MKKHKPTLTSAALIGGAALVFSCAKAPSDMPYWDAETEIYHIPELALQVALPDTIDWTIAPPDALPQGLLFGAHDAQGRLMLSVVRSAEADTSEAAVSRFIAALARQDAAEASPEWAVTYSEPRLTATPGGQRLRQTVSLYPADTIGDTLCLTNIGQICARNGHIYAMLCMSPDSTVTEEILTVYRQVAD